MPDVGLTTATAPLGPELRVVVRYSVEVEGLAVYQESYDVEKLREEIASNESEAMRLWFRRLACVVVCRNRPAFSASVTRCLAAGMEAPEAKI